METYTGPQLPDAPQRLDDTCAVWAEMIALGQKYKCQSLGEGAPGYAPPEFLKEAMARAIDKDVG